MHRFKLIIYLLLGICCIKSWADFCETPPDVDSPPPYPVLRDTYVAKTEEIKKVKVTDVKTVSLVTEEVYDGPNNRIALDIVAEDMTIKYIMDWNTTQITTIRVLDPHTDRETRECYSKSLEDGVIFFPPLVWEGKNITIDHIVSPGLLMGALNWTNAHYKGIYTFRDIEAHRWDWCGVQALEKVYGTYTSLQTYWSVPDWRVPTVHGESKHSIPLGWEVVSSVEEKTELLLAHNIMYYMEDVTNFEAFDIPSGIHCDNKTSTRLFPVFDDDRMFKFSLEFSLPGDHYISWADGWYDFKKQLYRIDHDIFDHNNDLETTTEIFDFPEAIVFTYPKNKISQCLITWINYTKTDWSDITGVQHLWGDSPASFFGSDRANYTYYGEKSTRYLRTNEWRGMRMDWPEDSSNGPVKTLWEWQFTNKKVSFISNIGDTVFIERTVPVALSVTAFETIHTDSGDTIPMWDAFDYAMYNFNMDPYEINSYADYGVFDLYNCYSANWRTHLMFQLDTSDWPEVTSTPLLNLPSFKEYWQLLLARTGNISYIRITRLSTLAEKEDDVWIDFVLLYRHPQIGQISHDLYESMTPGRVAIQYIKEAIDNGTLHYHSDENDKDLPAVKDSLQEVTDPTCGPISSTTSHPGTTSSHVGTTSSHTGTTTPHTGTTTPHTGTTSTKPGTTSTKPGTTSSQSITTNNGQTTSQNTETTSATTTTIRPPHVYSGGDLAGLGIGMTLTGIAVGAGLTFLVQVKQIHVTFITWIKSK